MSLSRLRQTRYPLRPMSTRSVLRRGPRAPRPRARCRRAGIGVLAATRRLDCLALSAGAATCSAPATATRRITTAPLTFARWIGNDWRRRIPRSRLPSSRSCEARGFCTTQAGDELSGIESAACAGRRNRCFADFFLSRPVPRSFWTLEISSSLSLLGSSPAPLPCSCRHCLCALLLRFSQLSSLYCPPRLHVFRHAPPSPPLPFEPNFFVPSAPKPCCLEKESSAAAPRTLSPAPRPAPLCRPGRNAAREARDVCLPVSSFLPAFAPRGARGEVGGRRGASRPRPESRGRTLGRGPKLG